MTDRRPWCKNRATGTERQSHGVALIASLLLLLLLSGIAIGLVYMTSTELRMGGTDLESNITFYAAEAGMEKMTADLASLYASKQSPTIADITTLQNFPPN